MSDPDAQLAWTAMPYRAPVVDREGGRFGTAESLLGDAVRIIKQHELLVGDALIVAIMQAHGLTSLASNDADFDRVPGITRYAPA